jgi:predicted nucleotidyltransferase
MVLQNQDYSEITRRIIKEIDVERVILFGSRARGDDRPGSDLDLLIIQKGEFTAKKSRWEEIIRIRKALRGFKIPKDILIYSESEIDYWKDSLNHIIPTCLKEGKVLYARS